MAPSASRVEGVSIYDTMRALDILPSSILESEGPGMWPARKVNVHKCHSFLLVSSCMGLEEGVCTILCVRCVDVCGYAWSLLWQQGHWLISVLGMIRGYFSCEPGLCLRHAPSPTSLHSSPDYY